MTNKTNSNEYDSIKEKETVIIDLTVLRNEHQEYKARCQRQTTN